MTAQQGHLTGGCDCRAIRYALSQPPFDADFCHCRTCQRTTGAPVSAWMDVKAAEVTWQTDARPTEYASSDDIRRGFCAACGSTLTYRSQSHPAYLTLAITSLDNPEAMTPRYHIHTNSSVSWLLLSDDAPRHETNRTKADTGD